MTTIANTQRKPGKPIALVVDDVKLYREVLRRWLDEMGYQTFVASGGNEGWKIFDSQRPSLVITDIDMIGGNGFELIGRIRGSKPRDNRSAIVAVMSSLQDDQIDQFSRSAGADHFLPKPLSKSSVIDLVEAARTGLDPNGSRREPADDPRKGSKTPSSDRRNREGGVSAGSASDRITTPVAAATSPTLRRICRDQKIGQFENN